jgi:hypothetical protein
MTKAYRKIHYHLVDFDFAKAKLQLAVEKGLQFIGQRDDLFPFIKLNETIIIKPLEKLRYLLPVVYWVDCSLRYGFITKINESSVMISTMKGSPKEWEVQTKFLLGRVHFFYPHRVFQLILERRLKSGKYRLLD